MNIYAHSVKGMSPANWQTLETHSKNVAELAAKFAAPFGSSETARLLGLVHDMGKANPAFQKYLQEANGVDDEKSEDELCEKQGVTTRKHGPDHSTYGAQWLDANVKVLGRLLAYSVAGHHSGLPDGLSSFSVSGSLCKRLSKQLDHIPAMPWIEEPKLQTLTSEAIRFLKPQDGFPISFYIRMLYSTLVDADFLDSESFINKERSRKRTIVSASTMNELLNKLESYYVQLDESMKNEGRDKSEVVRIRNEVRDDCICAANNPPGLFTLKVPTGGGKTLASMLFALNHAIKNQLGRVIVTIPFTSIIEQTADVYRKIFGDENVLEHHCNVDDDRQSEQMRLAAENWDAPIVVTTNVQLFESLFASRSSRCRKLHNLARSVIVLDEAQSVPVELLKPCLKSLEELVARYGSSIVLSTATLPVFFNRDLLGAAALIGGENGVLDIVKRERHLEERLCRVRVTKISGTITDEELLSRFQENSMVLVIVSTRRHARELYQKAHEKFSDRSVYHLSAQMCGMHRISVLNKVKECLKNQMPCILVSTQLIEAGVDIDFPCVYREIAGVDSMAQAAGRCNREGKIREGGKVVLFESADYAVPGGLLRTAAQQGRLTLQLPEVSADLLGEESVRKYFSLLYADVQKGNAVGMDRIGALTDLLPSKRPRDMKEMFLFQFRQLGEAFKLIEANTCSIIVPYEKEGQNLCEQLRKEYNPIEQRRLVRKLQRYTVSLYGMEPVDNAGTLIADKVHGTYWILTSPDQYYDSEFGIVTEPREILLTA